ncbi:hypothetical protein NMY22_g15187 [Coprinellus aureogranulatus]|nr:hypothetical protein NMY22_g15187 [Coprinellus aureogranulatus]
MLQKLLGEGALALASGQNPYALSHDALVDPPPLRHTDPTEDARTTEEYYESVVASDIVNGVSNLVDFLDVRHAVRVQDLESMPQRTLDTIWCLSFSMELTAQHKQKQKDPRTSILSPDLDGSAIMVDATLGHAHPALTLAAARASGRYGHVMFPQATHLPHFHAIMATLAYVQTPLSISSMASLLGISTFEIIRVLVVLQSILQVPGRDDAPVTFFHTSLRDFLTAKDRSGPLHAPAFHHIHLMQRCLESLFGDQPSCNMECCKYAMLYWAYHLEMAGQLDPAFNIFYVLKPAAFERRGIWMFQQQWMENRPLTLVLSHSEWDVLVANLHKADAVFRGADSAQKSSQGSIVSDPEQYITTNDYYANYADKSQWRLAQTLGYGGSCPPIVRVDSYRACSALDILQGFCALVCPRNQRSCELHLAIRTSERVSVNIKFTRHGLPYDEATHWPSYMLNAGCSITISNDLRVVLDSGADTRAISLPGGTRLLPDEDSRMSCITMLPEDMDLPPPTIPDDPAER